MLAYYNVGFDSIPGLIQYVLGCDNDTRRPSNVVLTLDHKAWCPLGSTDPLRPEV